MTGLTAHCQHQNKATKSESVQKKVDIYVLPVIYILSGLENNIMRIKTFGEITAKVCKEFKATFVDTIKLLDEDLDGNFRPDGYNLSDNGEQLAQLFTSAP